MLAPSPAMQDRAVVIGGGRWGRTIAAKLAPLGFQVFVATEYPQADSDITRAGIFGLEPKPSLIYVASRSQDHVRDYDLVAPLGVKVWIEKNFHRLDSPLIARFLGAGHGIFSQQLFNESIDGVVGEMRGPVRIVAEIEKPVTSAGGLFDWICHDLSLIARVLWLRADGASAAGAVSLRWQDGACDVELSGAGMTFQVELRHSGRRRRTVFLGPTPIMVAGRDGILRPAPHPGTDDGDLLSAALQLALKTPKAQVRALTGAVLALHRAALPLIEALPDTAFQRSPA